MTAKTLAYQYQRQTTGYYCAPAAVRVALSVRGVVKNQDQLARELRTTVNGTDSSNDVVRVLNANLGPWYQAKFIPGQSPTGAESAQFKADVIASLNASVPVVCNIVGSSSDVEGRSYSYEGGHYFTVVGYRNDGDEVLVADVAIREYWMSTAKLAVWVAARGYSTAKAGAFIPPTPSAPTLPPVATWYSLAPASTIFAVDLSDFDSGRGNNPNTVRRYRAEGVAIVTHKTTETAPNQVFRHVKLGAMLGAARDGGVPFLGGYVVPRSGPSVAAQGANHIAFLDQQVPWWRGQPGFFHQVDLEKWEYDAVSADVGNRLFDWLKANGGGKPVVLYASQSQYGASELRYPRWNANYPTSARTEYRALYANVGGNTARPNAQGLGGWEAYGSPSRSAELWQYSSAAIVAGQHTTDISAFRGSEKEFARALGFPASGGGTVTPKEERMLIRPIGKSTVHGGERSAVYTTNGQSRIWLKSSADVLDVQGALRACGLHAEIVPVGSGANFGPIIGPDPGDV